MVSLYVLIALLHQVSGFTYGYYEYYKYFGPTLYHSGGAYHGYNGLEPGSDSNDAIQTDRGLYFDGVSGCATQHASHWTDPSPLVVPIMVTMWVLPLGDGPIVARLDATQNQPLFEVRYKANLQTLEFIVGLGSTYTAYHITHTGSAYREWVYVAFYIAIGDSYTILNIYSEENLANSMLVPSVSYSEIAENEHVTKLGCNPSSMYGNSILYILAIDNSSTLAAGLLTTQCGNQCEFGTHATYCACSTCSAVASACISTNLEPLQDGSGVACTTYSCGKGCSAGGQCYTCDASKWPVCDEKGVDFTTLCHADCASCTGPLASDCASCATGFYLDGTVCQACSAGCLSCTGPLSSDCLLSQAGEVSSLCLSGEYWDGKACNSCHSDCATCVGSLATDCSTCTDPLKFIETSPGECVCIDGYYWDLTACQICDAVCSTCKGPLDTDCMACSDPLQSVQAGQCICNSGYYFDGLACQSCYSDCATCTGPLSTDCTSCSDSLKIVDTGQCVCTTGYYFDGTVCQACHSLCETCTGPLSTDCTACADTLQFLDSSTGECTCPDGYFWDGVACETCYTDCATCSEANICSTCVVSGAIPDAAVGCACPAGQFSDGLACQVCHSHCSSCSEASTCDTCLNPNAQPDSTSGCTCSPGYYGDGITCTACHADCATCQEPSLCLTCTIATAVPASTEGCACAVNAVDTGSECVCNEGYYMSGGNCILCDPTCATCASSSTCLTCSDLLAELDNFGLCVCKQNAKLLNDNCVCQNGYFETGGNCVENSQVSIEPASFSSVEGCAVATILATGALGLMITENPSSIWSLLNTIELLSCIPLTAIDLSEDLFQFFRQMDISSYFLDVHALFFQSVEVNQDIPTTWQEYGFITSHFVFNTAPYIVLLLLILASLLLLSLIYCLPLGQWVHGKCLTALEAYRFNVFVRLWIQAYLGLGLASILSVQELCRQNYEWFNILGTACGICLVCLPLALGSVTYRNEKVGKINHQSSLYYEFIPRNVDLSYGYYTYFFTRRLLFVLILCFLQEYPIFQITLSAFLSFIHLALLCVVFRFASKIDHIQAITIEVGIFVVLGLLVAFINTNNSQNSVSFVIKCLVMCMIGASYFNLFLRTLVGAIEKCKNLVTKRDDVGTRTFTHVRVMKNYQIHPEESKDDSFQLHRVNLNAITMRPKTFA